VDHVPRCAMLHDVGSQTLILFEIDAGRRCGCLMLSGTRRGV
jgi:hypothetical protein